MTDQSQSPFRFRFRVRYGECDAQGVVFNARYGDFVDISVNEYIRTLFGDYQRLLDHIKPDVVHIMADGRIVKSGGPELALEVENNGYADLLAEVA